MLCQARGIMLSQWQYIVPRVSCCLIEIMLPYWSFDVPTKTVFPGVIMLRRWFHVTSCELCCLSSIIMPKRYYVAPMCTLFPQLQYKPPKILCCHLNPFLLQGYSLVPIVLFFSNGTMLNQWYHVARITLCLSDDITPMVLCCPTGYVLTQCYYVALVTVCCPNGVIVPFALCFSNVVT